MTLPQLAKTWQFNVNQTIKWQGNLTLTDQLLYYTIKQTLRAWTSRPWTVRGSSDGATAGMDGLDRWTTPAKLIWAGGAVAHSWVVLEQTGLTSVGNPPTSGFQLLIDLNNGSANTASFYASHTGAFTGGTVTARPTATDEFSIGKNNVASMTFPNWSSGAQLQLHMMQSSDGKCTRVFVMGGQSSGPQVLGGLMCEDVANPLSAMQYPPVATVYGPQGNYGDFMQVGATGEMWSGRDNGTNYYAATTAEGIPNKDLAEQIQWPNEVTGEWCMHPLGLYVPNTTFKRGRLGSLYDLWFGPGGLTHGTMFPNNSSYKFAKIGPLVVPWLGSGVGYTPAPMLVA